MAYISAASAVFWPTFSCYTTPATQTIIEHDFVKQLRQSAKLKRDWCKKKCNYFYLGLFAFLVIQECVFNLSINKKIEE